MGSRIQCFFLEPSERAEESLRRYARGAANDCPGPYSYHNAEVVIGEVHLPMSEWNGSGDAGESMRDDPRWPTKCACGYEFTPDDHWQHNITRKHRRTDTGELHTLDGAPVGAMWYADYYKHPGHYDGGPDGHCLVVKTPGGDWIVDGPRSDGSPGWTRSGAPPLVTANPSILFPKPHGNGYHAFLRAGWLEEC